MRSIQCILTMPALIRNWTDWCIVTSFVDDAKARIHYCMSCTTWFQCKSSDSFSQSSPASSTELMEYLGRKWTNNFQKCFSSSCQVHQYDGEVCSCYGMIAQ